MSSEYGRRKSDEPQQFERNELGVTVPINNQELYEAEKELHEFGYKGFLKATGLIEEQK